LQHVDATVVRIIDGKAAAETGESEDDPGAELRSEGKGFQQLYYSAVEALFVLKGEEDR
jgi:hypothetical protein